MMVPAYSVELPEGADLIRLGRWYWWRDAEGEVHETVLPDQNFAPVSDDEVAELLAR